MVTLKDIADLVGVSVSTVSRVINDDRSRHANEETRNKIWKAVQETGYEANESARRLVRSKKDEPKASMQVGCIVFAPQLMQHHPYFSPILSGVQKELFQLGYTFSAIHSMEEVRNEAVLHKAVKESAVDGMIIVGEIDPPILAYIRDNIPAIVGIDVTSPDPGFSIVDYDRLAAVRTAVQHLVDQGHERIGFVGGGLGLANEGKREARFRGYLEAMRELDLELNPDWMIETKWDVARSHSGMLDMLQRQSGKLPTAMVAASDMMAIPAMRAVAEQNLRIPENIAFVGIDNIEIAEYTSPPLSSLHIAKSEIGMMAARTLVDIMQNKLTFPIRIQIPHQLMIRQSSDYCLKK